MPEATHLKRRTRSDSNDLRVVEAQRYADSAQGSPNCKQKHWRLREHRASIGSCFVGVVTLIAVHYGTQAQRRGCSQSAKILTTRTAAEAWAVGGGSWSAPLPGQSVSALARPLRSDAHRRSPFDWGNRVRAATRWLPRGRPRGSSTLRRHSGTIFGGPNFPRWNRLADWLREAERFSMAARSESPLSTLNISK